MHSSGLSNGYIFFLMYLYSFFVGSTPSAM